MSSKINYTILLNILLLFSLSVLVKTAIYQHLPVFLLVDSSGGVTTSKKKRVITEPDNWFRPKKSSLVPTLLQSLYSLICTNIPRCELSFASSQVRFLAMSFGYGCYSTHYRHYLYLFLNKAIAVNGGTNQWHNWQ